MYTTNQRKNNNNKTNDNKVDYTFYYRSQVNQMIDDLLKADEHSEYNKIHMIINDLREMEPHLLPVISERLRYASRDELGILSHLLLLVGEDKNIESKMVTMLLDPDIPDRNKGNLISVMEMHGYNTEIHSMDAVFKDPEKMIKESKEALVDDIKKNPMSIASLFRELQDMPITACQELLEAFKNRKDYQLVDFFKSLALLDAPTLAREGVAQLGNIPHKASRRALKELRAQPDRHFIHGEIDRQLQRLNLMGLEKEENQPDIETALETSFRQLGSDYYAAITQVDASCNRVLVISRRSKGADGGLLTMTFNINVQKGITRCNGFFQGSTKDYKELIKELRTDQTLVIEEPAYVRDIFRDALYNNLENETPFSYEFAFWRQFIPSEWLKPESFTPSFKDEMKNLPESMDELDRELKDIGNYRRFDHYLLDHPYVDELANEMLRWNQEQSEVKLLAQQEEVESVYEELMEDMVMPNLNAYRRSFMLMADMYRKRGWNKLCRKMLAAVKRMSKGDLETIKSHPIFIKIGMSSLNNAAHFLYIQWNQ